MNQWFIRWVEKRSAATIRNQEREIETLRRELTSAKRSCDHWHDCSLMEAARNKALRDEKAQLIDVIQDLKAELGRA